MQSHRFRLLFCRTKERSLEAFNLPRGHGSIDRMYPLLGPWPPVLMGTRIDIESYLMTTKNPTREQWTDNLSSNSTQAGR